MALGASTVWEIRQDGDDDNGGGFDETVGVDGVDYSQQAAAQLSGSDGACVAATPTTFTSATGGFTLAMEGNVIHIYDGTNLLDGWYSIETFNSSNSVTLDRTPRDGADVSAADFKVGGALASIGGLGAVFANSADEATAGMKAFIKYSATDYVLTNANANQSGGCLDFAAGNMNGKQFHLIGYDTDRDVDNTDANRPTIDCDGNAPTYVFYSGAGNYADGHFYANLVVDGDSQNTIGLRVESYNVIRDIDVHHCAGSHGFQLSRTGVVRCFAYDNTNNGFYYGYCSGCRSHGNDVGYYYPQLAVNCIADGNIDEGYYSNTLHCTNCVSYDNGGDGFDTVNWSGCIVNCVSVSDGGYSVNYANVAVMGSFASDGATSGRTNTTPAADIDPIVLTADPFTDADNGDFSLNNAAGGGALLRAAGWSPAGQTGYLDVGAVQHEDAGGGGTSTPTGAISQQWAR